MIDEYLERELQNWALWRCAGGWGYMAGSLNVTCDYSPVETRYREARVPILAGAAGDVEAVVSKIEKEQRAVLHAQYLNVDKSGHRIPQSFSQAQIARGLAMSVRSFERLLSQGRRAVADGLAELKRVHRAA